MSSHPPLLRHALVATMMLVLALAGIGRGLATGGVGQPPLGIPGVAFRICHAGDGGTSLPDGSSRHDCCDACALGALATPAPPPRPPAPVVAVSFIAPLRSTRWTPTVVRLRSPRQSQGPPTA